MSEHQDVDDVRIDLPPGTTRLSLFQESFWYLKQIDPHSGSFNVSRAWILRGSLDVDQLKRALNGVVARHDILRSCVRAINGVPYQVILGDAAIHIQQVDISYLAEQQADECARAMLSKEIARQFDFYMGPLLRVVLIKVANDKNILLIVKPHLITDVASMEIFIKEISTLYSARSPNEYPSLSDRPTQYSVYASRQRDALDSRDYDGDTNYWASHLRDAPTELRFSQRADLNLRSHTFDGREVRFSLDPERLQHLKVMSEDAGSTLQILLLSAYAIALSRMVGQHDLIIGTLTANRIHQEASHIIGPLVNTFALRLQLGRTATVLETIKQVRCVVLGAYRHRQLPFERLVHQLKTSGHLDPSFRLQVMFNYIEGNHNLPNFDGLTLEPIQLDRNRSQADITLRIRIGSHSADFWIEYNSTLICPEYAQQFASRYLLLLNELIDSPNKSISSLNILDESERHQVLHAWREITSQNQPTTCLHTLVATQAIDRPDQIAVICGENHFSYLELEQRSNQLARHLRQINAPSGSTIRLFVSQPIDLIVAILGIWKAGYAYLLNPQSGSVTHLSCIRETDSPRLPILNSCAEFVTTGESAPLIDVFVAESSIRSQSTTALDLCVHTDDIACICYNRDNATWMKLTHRDVANHLTAGSDVNTIISHKRVATGVSIAWELLGLLARGNELAIIPDLDYRSPTLLAHQIKASAASCAILTSDALISLLRCDSCDHGELHNVRLWRCRGIQFSLELMRRFKEQLPWATLQFVYEITSFFEAIGSDDERNVISAARSPSNTWVYVLDDALQPSPIGVAGDLYIASASFPNDRRHQTAISHFLIDPFCSDGEKMYFTGYRAHWQLDGTLRLLSREIESRGHFIDLDAIETACIQHPSVSQVVVDARDIGLCKREPIAYVVPTDRTMDMSALRRYLSQCLPEYMMPATIVAVGAFPITVTGNIDFDALPDASTIQEITASSIPTANEALLAQLFSEILGLDGVSIDDSFFGLGGHSLQAVALINRIRETFNFDLTLDLLFESPTVAGLAKVLCEVREVSS
ncbi:MULTISPECIES: non-ribosomal peptide synthetase [unclassified Bradyrhizobium]|uniref:non-ribosomal peptide synthetase n=1 Tax=unclassified Bradyrhizobium TaxID=2631580 RepID=UPI002916D350|nr:MULTISPECIES: condensation domain-containing protein [unclassified Bradyrhizobium]